MSCSKMRKKKLIEPEFKNGTKEYFDRATVYAKDSRINSEFLEILNEVWEDGRLFGNYQLEFYPPDEKVENHNGYYFSDGRISVVYDKGIRGGKYVTTVPTLFAEGMLSLKRHVKNQRLFWYFERDGLTFKLCVKRKFKEVKPKPL